VKVFLIFFFNFLSFVTLAQNQLLNGKVIGQELIPLPAIQIFDEQGVLLGKTDFEGRFQINLPSNITKISFQGIGYQTEIINITKDCSYIQLVFLQQWIYDFVSEQKAKRKLRKDRKKQLPLLYDKAFTQGIFQKKTNSCIGYLY
jgi:hypothetical protein